MAAVIGTVQRRAGRAVQLDTPVRLRLWMLTLIAAAGVVLAATSLLMSRVQGQVDTIGDEAAPMAATASDLYFALSDLDAQVARLVLINNAEAQAGNQIDALSTYRERSRQIDADIERALTIAGGSEDRALIRSILDRLAVYRQWTWQALTVEWQQPAGTPGQLPPAALGYYAQATNVLHVQLLPAAKELRDASEARLDRAYADQRATSWWGVGMLVVAGGGLVAALVVLQIWLVRQFRRRLNPALLAGTVITLTLLISAGVVLGVEAERLSAAHRNGFAPFLELSKAQAISYDAAADTSRYLLSADLQHYERDFARKSRCLVNGGDCGGGETIDGGLAAVADGPGTRGDAGREVRDRWLAYQRDHERIVTLADSGRRAAAIDALTGIRRGDAAFDFSYYDAGISELTAERKRAFDTAFRDAAGLLTGWSVIPVVVLVAVICLVPLGLWPRLTEYR